ncbi:META domain-containing protein [Vibrio europaeus]|jgi:heat shock protein HslJ|uniref:Heat shock protein HslJ n=3 Tax=Vibrio oreintalis group TaxID=1891919 RepID=F9T9T9_9VIBR|nr:MULTISPECIES: META domain-containing protein [Vibrio oreintalis group]AIW13792.1 heat shock protein HslJ [Vibrio tubiashii ATCC 19109]EGU50849.1 heat shock protein HslJ [Vibrio tubiashii ATCC 19109]EIF05221.1 heat shock protein HslJ [Vibrio tubiashii NCIMB 1337 = ATCC 19106]MCG9582848.1 META domain-containing protein [Vibrio tubiashii]MCG9616442.1 META domain-containing protein [Vibrio tubiashii]
MKLSPKTLLAAITLPLVVTACASNGDDVKQITAQDLQHHNWELVSIDGEAVVADSRQNPPRLEIGEKMTANGNAGCNNFFGQAELKDNQFRIEKMGMTMKMCVGDVMDVEQAFGQTLSDWSDMTLTQDTMVLKNDVHTLTFKLNDWKN